MKKIVAMALCLVMVIGLMTGCQKAMDVQTLVQKMDEAMKTVTAERADAEMDLEMKMASMGVTMSIGLDMDMSIRAKADLSAMYMDMNMAAEAMGQSEEMRMEMYMNLEDDAMVMYYYDSESESWIKTSMDGYSEMMTQIQEMGLEQQAMSQLPKESLTLAKEQITVNDRKCYVLTAAIDGAYIQETIGKYMDEVMAESMETEEMDEEAKAQVQAVLEGMDWSKLGGQTVYHVDAETFLPLEMSMEVLGVGDVFNGMIQTLMGEMMMEMDEEAPAFSIEVPTFTMTVKNMAYNDAVEIPAVPQEAIDNAVDADAMMEDPIVDDPDMGELTTNLPQADGSYLMTVGGHTASVMVPEGYIVYAAEDEMVVAMTEDMLNSVNYMLVTDITGEDIRVSAMEEVDWAKEENFYKSHTEVEELNGFNTMSLIYNDNTSIWWAWQELDGCVLLLGAQVEGETYDLAALIGSVTLAE